MDNNKDKIVPVRFSKKDLEDLKKLEEDWGVKSSEAVRRAVLIASGRIQTN